MISKKNNMSAKNKAFWKKSKPAQAVLIAKDVLIQLRDKFIVAEAGEYFKIEGIEETMEIPKSTKKLDETFLLLKNQNATCNVCSIGSCFVSLVNLGNGELHDNWLHREIGFYNVIGGNSMRPLLRKVFTASQLTLIETAFEKRILTDTLDIEYGDASRNLKIKARIFGERYIRDRNRLIYIMKNIIKNKGVFKP